jgi:WG repeat protein
VLTVSKLIRAISQIRRFAVFCGALTMLVRVHSAAQACRETQAPSSSTTAPIGLLKEVKSENGKWGYQDETGAYRIPPQFDDAEDFSEGLAAVEIRGKFGYVDTSGKVAITPKFIKAGPFSEGLALVYTRSGFNIFGIEGTDFFRRAGYIDHTGKFVIEPRFAEGAGSFSEGLVAFQPGLTSPGGAKWGYLDKTGKWFIKPRFDVALCFSEGLAAVGVSEKTKGGRQKLGYIDRNGDFVIAPQFYTAFPFKNGVAQVSLSPWWDADTGHSHWKCIDRKGAIVACPTPKGRPTKPAESQATSTQ